MLTEIRPLQTIACRVTAILTGEDGPGSDVLKPPDRVVPFDGSRPRLPAEGSTYREALGEIDRRAKESGADELWRKICEVYGLLRGKKLADNRVFAEDWLMNSLWGVHKAYWQNRQRAAFEAGFAAGEGLLRGNTGPRLVDHKVDPPSVEPETYDQQQARKQRERADAIRTQHRPTPDLTLDKLPFSTPRNVARLKAEGLFTLADVAAKRTAGWYGDKRSVREIPYYQHADELLDWVFAAGLSFSEEKQEASDQTAHVDQGGAR